MELVVPEPEPVSYRCSTCGFQLFNPIAELQASTLGLYSDARFPGRALLVFRDHFGDFTTMPSGKSTAAFVEDMQTAGRAIQKAVNARRINYAILGNAVPHVHAHIIPRALEGDPIPNRTPWAHPDEVTPLSDETLAELSRKILKELGNLVGSWQLLRYCYSRVMNKTNGTIGKVFGVDLYFDDGVHRVFDQHQSLGYGKKFGVTQLGYGTVQDFDSVNEAISIAKELTEQLLAR
jgi:diadenosine tetraphosphate (Ap4A) HIT family hydrolase